MKIPNSEHDEVCCASKLHDISVYVEHSKSLYTFCIFLLRAQIFARLRFSFDVFQKSLTQTLVECFVRPEKSQSREENEIESKCHSIYLE